jgi:hypothetical protein
VCFASKKIREREEILYKYTYSVEENVGRWYDGEGLVRVEGRELPRRCRQMTEYFDVLRTWFRESNTELPNKSKAGASMKSQQDEYGSTARCLYCGD